MNLSELKTYLHQKAGTTEETPFGPEALVYKVMGKMFALVGHMSDPLTINLKCDPDDSLALRDQYESINPGYHMNKKHWNTITLNGEVPEPEIYDLIDHSYRLVVNGLRKAQKEELAALSTKGN